MGISFETTEVIRRKKAQYLRVIDTKKMVFFASPCIAGRNIEIL